MIRFILLIIIFCSCSMQKPVSMAHVERIEERVMPIPVAADTIEIVLSHTDNILHTEDLSHTECTECTEFDFSLCSKSFINEFSASAATASSVNSVSSVSEKENSVRISSTRGINISRHETDTTSTLRITLRPDTVFVPYTNHIRSDTIVVPDRICQQKLNQTKFMNIILLIILILFVATIIYKKIFHR